MTSWAVVVVIVVAEAEVAQPVVVDTHEVFWSNVRWFFIVRFLPHFGKYFWIYTPKWKISLFFSFYVLL
jgi:hypothetical protein